MTKKVYLKDIEYTKKRLKMALWFEVNQYRKEIRAIRTQWMDLIKNENN